MEIQETGIRGYLKWLQHDQPGIYKLAAPRIARLIPEAFSNHEQSKAMGVLMDDDFIQSIGVTIPEESTDVANAADPGASSPSIVSGISSIIDSIANAYQAKAQSDQAKILTQTQADIYRQVTQTQLQRAAAGLPPLTTQSGQYGIPTIAPSAVQSFKSGTAWAIGALLLFGGLAMLGKRR